MSVHVDVSNIPVNIVNSQIKKVVGQLTLEGVKCFSWRIFDNIKCEDLHLVEMFVPAELPEGINVSGDILLLQITGNVIGLIDRITCKCLRIDYMKLNSDTTSSLTKILRSRVREIKFSFNGTLEDFSILESYDGKGHCEKIMFLRKSDDNEWRKIFNINLAPWAASKNWTVAKLAVGYEFKRSVIST